MIFCQTASGTAGGLRLSRKDGLFTLETRLFLPRPLEIIFPFFADAGARFPRLIASNLEKRTLTLPDDFEGSHNFLLVAFKRDQQRQVDTWLREMRRFEELDPEFRYYELPTIQSPNRLVRWFIDTGMRRGIPDQKARSRTITLYIDKQPFLKALGITDENRIYCFLVNRSGQVLWRDEGVFDDSKAVSLRECLQSLMKPPSEGLK